MAVFDVHIRKYDRQIGKIRKYRNINLSDFDGCVEALVGFAYKLLNNAVFEQKRRDQQPRNNDQNKQYEVKKYFLKLLQAEKMLLQKYVTTIKHKKLSNILIIIELIHVGNRSPFCQDL